MSLAELYEIYYLAQESIDRLLQFLITISFAVVVAAFMGEQRLTRFFYAVMGLVYSLVFVVLAFRMNTAIEKVIEIQRRLTEVGEVFVEYPWIAPVSGVTGILIYAATLGFLAFCAWRGHQDRSA